MRSAIAAMMLLAIGACADDATPDASGGPIPTCNACATCRWKAAFQPVPTANTDVMVDFDDPAPTPPEFGVAYSAGEYTITTGGTWSWVVQVVSKNTGGPSPQGLGVSIYASGAGVLAAGDESATRGSSGYTATARIEANDVELAAGETVRVLASMTAVSGADSGIVGSREVWAVGRNMDCAP